MIRIEPDAGSERNDWGQVEEGVLAAQVELVGIVDMKFVVIGEDGRILDPVPLEAESDPIICRAV
jgi:hypothetical protein